MPVPQPEVPQPVRPTEMVIGPRIDVISPSKLQAGQRYTLHLIGKNFSSETTITFGKDVTIVGTPLFTSPTEATVDVLVSLTAARGPVAAVASTASASNSGPGAILLGPAPTGPTIIPDAPFDGVTLAGQLAFSWHESQPGAASFFVFEILDDTGSVLFAAQTPKTSFPMVRPDIDLLPRGRIRKAARWRVHGIGNKTEVIETSEERAIVLPPRP